MVIAICLQSRLVYGISLTTNRAAFPPVKQKHVIDSTAFIVALVKSRDVGVSPSTEVAMDGGERTHE